MAAMHCAVVAIHVHAMCRRRPASGGESHPKDFLTHRVRRLLLTLPAGK